jgi:mycothione reductase
MPHHELLIIGTGSGNTLVTDQLEGLDIGVVEAGRFGGTCLNVGCIPTKMFVIPADRVVEARESERIGVTVSGARADWAAIRDRVFARIDSIADGGEEYRISQPFVTVYKAEARFVGERRLALSTGEELTADVIVVAAGGRPAFLDVPGLDAPDPARGVHSSDTVMRMDRLPRRMVVIGGGYVACEFAHVFTAYGVAVTQVQRSATLLVREEAEVAHTYTEVSKDRLDVRLRTVVTGARRDGDEWVLTLHGPDGPEEVRTDVVLMAVGRVPNSDRIDAAAGGLETSSDGLLMVDDLLRTTSPRVWALGDICSPHQLKHVANHEARILAHNLAVAFGRADGPPRRLDDRVVPHGIFGHPQIAAFGPTRAALEAAGTEFVSYTQRFSDVAQGWALEEPHGLLTVHAAPDGRILAAHCVGPHSSTLIQPLIQAATFGQHAFEVARGQYWIHPALAEVVENALLGLELRQELAPETGLRPVRR